MSDPSAIPSSLRPVRGRRRGAVSYVLVLAALAPGCGGAEEAPPLTPEVILARDRAADQASLTNWIQARETLRPLVERENAAVEDLLRAANAALAGADGTAEDKVAAAERLIDRAARLTEDDPVLLWCQFRVARLQSENDRALDRLQRIREIVPEDVPTRLAVAILLQDLNRIEEAKRDYEEFVSLHPGSVGSWRMVALYKLGQLLMILGQVEDGKIHLNEFDRLMESGLESPGEPAHQPGTLGVVLPHTPIRYEISPPVHASREMEARSVAAPGRPTGFTIMRRGWGRTETDLGKARKHKQEELWEWEPDPPFLVTWGPGGLYRLTARLDGTRRAETLLREPVLDAVPFDRMNVGANPSDEAQPREGDQDMDLLVAVAGRGLVLLENKDGFWVERGPTIFDEDVSAAGRIVPVDFDHDGDLDLLAALPGGVRLFRNDGFDSPEGALTDVTEEVELPEGDWIPITEDVDGDNDVDFLFVAPDTGRTLLYDNERRGRFREASDTLPELRGRFVVAADFDGDGRVDLAAFGDFLRLYLRTETGGWNEPLQIPLRALPIGPPVAADWDLDGTTDLLWPTATTPAAGLLAPGFLNGAVAFELGAPLPVRRSTSPLAALRVADPDGDGDLDLLLLDAGALVEYRTPGEGRGILLGLQGHKDNSHGVGAIVELRQGLSYRRIYWHGRPELVGFPRAGLDEVRVTWPSGVRQSHFRLPDGRYLLWQRRGLAGSCPFLYTWNGETYELVSDVLGITPLGLPMAPGQLVPPDHDEYVLVRGDQLVPRAGVLELQLTEELREVTYLDRIRLEVVDHPSEVEVFPNERFTFPPFPAHHIHTVRDALAPLSARDGAGRDWTDVLSADDGALASPFEPLRGQFRGLATPHFLELAFDPERWRTAGKLRLLMNGWLFWTDASVNVAAARHPEVEFVPPTLQVPDGEGGWRDAGPPLGFPAGKLKTMVVDVTARVNRDDPRVRIFSTLRLYWDSIRLAVDDDDAPTVVTSLEPTTAVLWERGFSEPIPLHGEHRLEWFEWDRLAAEPRWNQHPGLYTRLGETLPLVTAIDDRFVVMGAGDALTVRFDAALAPPLAAGWTRDYLVFLDGWAKDRDHNTVEALTVEPLPFHGMSGYPYGADEHFPDDEAHRAWRRDWQTRPARRWIEPLAPVRASAAAVPAAYHQPDSGE